MLVAAGLLLVPWVLYLSGRLPDTARARNWSLMWTGLDVAEAVGLVLTGVLQWRHSRHRALPAAFTGALLTVDAWVDVTTSAPGHARFWAILMACAVEVPAAVACLLLATWTYPRPPSPDLEPGAGRPMPPGTHHSDPPVAGNGPVRRPLLRASTLRASTRR